jgi:hypothetical protein
MKLQTCSPVLLEILLKLAEREKSPYKPTGRAALDRPRPVRGPGA